MKLKKIKLNRFALYIISVLLSMVILLTALFWGFNWVDSQKVNLNNTQVIYEHKPTIEENLTILYMSCAEEGDVADVFQLIHYDAVRSAIYTFALPSELIATVDEKTDTLSEQYDYQSIMGAVYAVENATGLKIDRYIRTNNEGVSGIVYNIGGIPCDIPEYVADQDFEFSKGITLLDGYAVSRFMYTENLHPSDRLTLQNELFKAALNKVFFTDSLSNGIKDDNQSEPAIAYTDAEKARLKTFYQSLFNYTETDISSIDIQFREKGIEKLFLDNQTVQVIDLTFDFSEDEITLSDSDKTIINSLITPAPPVQ